MLERGIPPYYASMVRHCMEYYINHVDAKEFPNKVDSDNWNAVSKALESYNAKERGYIIGALKEDNLAAAIRRIAATDGITEGSLWRLIRRFEKDVAIQRGLYCERRKNA